MLAAPVPVGGGRAGGPRTRMRSPGRARRAAPRGRHASCGELHQSCPGRRCARSRFLRANDPQTLHSTVSTIAVCSEAAVLGGQLPLAESAAGCRTLVAPCKLWLCPPSKSPRIIDGGVAARELLLVIGKELQE